MRRILVILLSLFAVQFASLFSEDNLGSESIIILSSPRSPAPGDTVRILIALEERQNGIEIGTTSSQDNLEAQHKMTGGEYPYWLLETYSTPAAGDYKVNVNINGEIVSSSAFKVTAETQPRHEELYIWKTERQWNRGMENLYSAWLEHLFVEDEEGANWDFLHELTGDQSRNILHNYLGLHEDNLLSLEPDCADNPFILRAYFSWKLGLPFGFRRCDWGGSQGVPTCSDWSTNHIPRTQGQNDVQAFQSFCQSIMNTIHSGSARTALDDELTDLYPVSLSRKELRPGVVFADPYGHTLTLVRWIHQAGDHSGQLLAVDAQPDGTIAVKRFWPGNFLFNTNSVIGEPGFKAFRPIIEDQGLLRPLSNTEIDNQTDYMNYSTEQHNLDPDSFYDTLGRLINPQPIDPVNAFEELHSAVYDRIKARAIAVEKGEEYMKENGYAVIPMPTGSSIFQTEGPWENFSTPSRDMRLLIALDLLLDFPEKIIRNPQSFLIPKNKTLDSVRVELMDFHKLRAQELTIDYTRSDGTRQELTLADIINRIVDLEMGYNPNDCVEIRWGAPQGSDERLTCSRRAPADQNDRMKSYRLWFKQRTFPRR